MARASRLGKAGWYSYDWIDNDFQPSADEIMPDYQTLEVSDQILMMPNVWFTVTSIDPGRSIVSMLEDGSTSWCLGLYPQDGGGTRLVSRRRPKWEKMSAFVIARPPQTSETLPPDHRESPSG